MVQYTEWRSISDGSIISSIPDSVLHHYDATELDLTDGEAVTNWPDSVGNEDLDGVGGPTYRTDGLNGNPSVEIDGVDDAFEGFYSVDQPCTIYMVIRSEDDGNRQAHLYDGDANMDVSSRWDEANQYNWRAAESGYQDTDDNTAQENAILVLEVDSTAYLRRNGEQLDSNSTGISSVLDGFYWGADDRDQRWTNGYLAELLIMDQVDRHETAEEESRLSDKWGIALE